MIHYIFSEVIPRIVRSWHLASIGLVLASTAAIILYFIPEPGDTHMPAPVTVSLPDTEQATGDTFEPVPDLLSENLAPPWTHIVTVRPGDSLAAIFARMGLTPAAVRLAKLGKVGRPLRYLHPGDILYLNVNEQGLQHLMLQATATQELHYRRTANSYALERVDLPIQQRPRVFSNVIYANLFQSGEKAGLEAAKILELAHIFSWDIDFALEIREGDQFKVVLNELWVNNRSIGYGPIVAAKFTSRKHARTFQAYRYTNSAGQADYYDPDGKPMRKQFLRTPVDFTRISSHFSRNRFHPIRKVRVPHRGVDYAAPTGTPVYAAGDGKVSFIGRKGGYGKVIILRHASQYTTVYAHLSRFARKLRKGNRIQQGQLIGRVGMTGLATGPHLHYEFRINGVHRNPVTVRLPDSKPLPHQEQPRFRSQIQPIIAYLDSDVEPTSSIALSE